MYEVLLNINIRNNGRPTPLAHLPAASFAVPYLDGVTVPPSHWLAQCPSAASEQNQLFLVRALLLGRGNRSVSFSIAVRASSLAPPPLLFPLSALPSPLA